ATAISGQSLPRAAAQPVHRGGIRVHPGSRHGARGTDPRRPAASGTFPRPAAVRRRGARPSPRAGVLRRQPHRGTGRRLTRLRGFCGGPAGHPGICRLVDNEGRMSKEYNAGSIEVLSGLDPVRRRPGMYTDTTRPNHLVQEVLDNSVDEALAGHARNIEVVLHKDGTVEVSDDGRGMPVDIHPEEKVSGVELILTRLHAGGKFSNENYRFSGGLHGVGVSVVNALSSMLEVEVKRGGNLYRMRFEGGEKKTELEIVDKVGQRNTGTTVRFLPDPKYFDSPNVSISRLVHVLRAKAVLCPGLRVKFVDNTTGGERNRSD